jgi:hypothetical protein
VRGISCGGAKLSQQSTPVTHGIGHAPTPSIGDDIDLFVRQIDSLAGALPMAVQVIHALNQTSGREYERFLEQEGTRMHDETGVEVFNVEGSKYFKARRFESRFQKARLAQELVPRTFFVSLVSQFDGFLGRLIRQLFNMKPEALDSSETKLSFSQLVKFGSMESAQEYIIDKEIDTVLRKSHAEQFDWLEKRFDISLRTDLPAWTTFIEATERRNLFVHSNGIVSHQYVEVCKRHSVPLDETALVGRTLPLSRQYFESAHECFFEIGVKLGQVLWRKVRPADLESADGNLISVSYELLEEGRYKLAKCLLDFATGTLKRHSKEEHRMRMVVNRAQAYKWSGDEATAREIICKVDWSATSPKFQIAQATLLDDFGKAVQFMSLIGASDPDIGKLAYREWTLFKELRKFPAFATAFERIFGEPLTTVRLPKEKIDSSGTGKVN